MKIVLNKCEGMNDWYTIIKAEHDGKEWVEEVAPNHSRLMLSERISDACVEGTAYEMLEIAKAIKGRVGTSFRRCAIFLSATVFIFIAPEIVMLMV